MANIFSKIEGEIFLNEEIIFDKSRIKEEVEKKITKELNFNKASQHFTFEEIIYDFLEYINVPLIKTKKTRDSGLDGIIKIKTNLIGEISAGLQIKHKIIDSTDIDSFISALKLSELQLGIITCKESRELKKYDLNSKLKTILLSRGITPKENLINEKIDINPISIIKFDDILNTVASEIRNFVRATYKK